MPTPRVSVETLPAATAVVEDGRPDPCVLVIFGATGDLVHRKLMPAIYQLGQDRALPTSLAVVGFSRSVKPAPAFRAELRESLGRFARLPPVDEAGWGAVAAAIETVAGAYDDPAAYRTLKELLGRLDRDRGTRGNRVYYLATPPSAFGPILEGLRGAGLLAAPHGKPWTRVVVEKPFGRDLASARDLNRLVASVADETQVYRIDHYLGKETVQNILVVRFANAIFEPLWNREHVSHVEITAAEEIGIGGRAGFYDGTGVLRDMVPNHLLQVLALVAMEPPVSFESEEIRDEKVKVLKALSPIEGEDVARRTVAGQYRGYREEPGVAPGSRTPTYVALEIGIDNWRWKGVPFYLRSGKRLKRRVTEVAIHFQEIPHCLFRQEGACRLIEPNVLVLRIQPDEGIALCFASKIPGDDVALGTVAMDFSYARGFEKTPRDAYERLLLDAIRGDPTLFSRQDDVEQSWAFVTPILEAWEGDPSPVPLYEPGGQGPVEADRMLARAGRRWRTL